MSLQINTNIMALSAQHMLAMNSSKYSKALERLSSGLRINRAADDAAGLAVSEKLKSQIRGTEQASRNAQDGISMIQTGEGALVEVHDMMQRMRELSVQGSNGTLASSDLGQINQELQQLKNEVNSVAQRTQFNGQSLLAGNLVTTQSGGTAVQGAQFNATGGNSSVTSVDVSKAVANATYAISSAAAGTLTMTRSTDSVAQTINVNAIGANGSQTLSFSQLGVNIALNSDAAGKTAAGVVTDLTGKTVITGAGSGSATFQVGANASDFINVSFSKIDLSGTVGGGSALDTLTTALNTFNTTQNTANAQALITAVDGALGSVSTQRANLGAFQNRLEHTINSLGVADTNLTASQSRIADADVAAETTHMVSAQILTQAGTSVLAQANQAPQGALSLLPR
jgi:flagellin